MKLIMPDDEILTFTNPEHAAHFVQENPHIQPIKMDVTYDEYRIFIQTQQLLLRGEKDL